MAGAPLRPIFCIGSSDNDKQLAGKHDSSDSPYAERTKQQSDHFMFSLVVTTLVLVAHSTTKVVTTRLNSQELLYQVSAYRVTNRNKPYM